MKINTTGISVPPYISTSWSNVKAVHVENLEEGKVLQVILNDDVKIDIPKLDDDDIKAIFDCHSAYLEKFSEEKTNSLDTFNDFQSQISSSFGDLKGMFGSGDVSSMNPSAMKMENFVGSGELSSFLKHDPSQSDAPDLPLDVLNRIASITKMLGEQEDILSGIEDAFPDCNCFHCQVVGAMRSSLTGALDENAGELVSEEDLKFREWDISSLGDKLYKVVNLMDENEYYQVFLGDPIGCTCGHNNCEHIRVVLSS